MHQKKERRRKVFLILKKIRKNELETLEKFLFNNCVTSEPIVELFQLLQKYHPRFTSFNNDIAKDSLFPKHSDSDKKLDKLFSLLHNQVLRFIAIREFEKDKAAKADSILNFYYQNELFPQFEKASLNEQKRLQTSTLRNADYYYRQMSFYNKSYFYTQPNKFKKEKENSSNRSESSSSLQHATTHLDISFILSRLRFTLEKLHRLRIFTEDVLEVEDVFLKAILKHVSQQKFYDNPILKIFTTLTQSALDKTKPIGSKALNQLIDDFNQNTQLISQTEQAELLQFLFNEVNYQLRISTFSQSSASQLRLKLYQIGMEKKCLLIYNEIPDVVFTNGVLIFAQSGDIPTAKAFLKKYVRVLNPRIRKEANRFAQASIFFYQSKFIHAEQLLNLKSKFTLFHLEHRAKTLLLCCQYELFLINKLDVISPMTPQKKLENAIAAFEKYYKRKENLTQNKKQPYLDFAFFLRQLVLLKTMSKNNALDEKKKLKDSFKSSKYIVARDWLENHVNQL